MSATYIAGYDGTESSLAAVRFAADLGPEGTRVIAVNVYPRIPEVFAAGASTRSTAAVQADICATAADLIGGLEEPRVERRIVAAESAAEGLYDLAVSQEADLIAIGVTHHGWLGRAIPGTVGHHLLHGAPCPVVVVPAGVGRSIETIAVAYDESAEAVHALEHATAIARRTGARLLVLGVASDAVHPTSAATGFGFGWSVPAGAWAGFRHELEQRLEQVAARLDLEPAAESRVLATPVGHGLVEACHAGVDLMVIGSRGFGPVRTVIMGSVSRHVIDHAPCPVIVVPRGDHAPHAEAPQPLVAHA
jgi:nucleotide-binding universal stress UspA family protein